MAYEERRGIHAEGGADAFEDIEVHTPSLPGLQPADGCLADVRLFGQPCLGPPSRGSELADIKAKRGHGPNHTRRRIIDATRLVV